jgi:hypothetical protein
MHSFLQLKTLRRIPWGIPLFYAQNRHWGVVVDGPIPYDGAVPLRKDQEAGEIRDVTIQETRRAIPVRFSW